MKNVKFATFIMTLILLGALFMPIVAAKENEKAILNEMSMPVIDTSKMSPLSEEDIKEVESLVYMFLKADEINIKNLDLSNMKIYESDTNIEIVGDISYTLDGRNQKAEIYSNHDFEKKSIDTISKSKTDYTRVTMKQVSESNDAIMYSIDTTSFNNNSVQKNVEYVSAEKSKATKDDTISEETVINMSKSGVYVGSEDIYRYDLPSAPPRLSYLMHDNVKLSNLVTAAGVVALFGTAVTTFITGGANALWAAYFDNISNVSQGDVYVDIYGMTSFLYYTPPRGVWGIAFQIPAAFGCYFEVDYYYKRVPRT